MSVFGSLQRTGVEIHGGSTLRVTVDARSDRQAERPVRVLVVDADGLSRRLVCDQLRDACGFVVVAQASAGREGVSLTTHYRPDIVLLEPDLPDVDGVTAVSQLVEASPESRVVVLAARSDERLAVRAFRAGVAGFLDKDLDPHVLPRVMSRVAAGEAVIPRRLASCVLAELRRVPERGYRPIHSQLTAREWEIIDLLAEGETTVGIAERLVLSQATVYTHIKHIMRKLEVSSRAEAVAAAQQLRPAELGVES